MTNQTLLTKLRKKRAELTDELCVVEQMIQMVEAIEIESQPRVPNDLLIHGWSDEELKQYHISVGEMIMTKPDETQLNQT